MYWGAKGEQRYREHYIYIQYTVYSIMYTVYCIYMYMYTHTVTSNM